MRTYFAYRKLTLHLPDTGKLQSLMEAELSQAGVTIGPSRDSLSYRAVTFPRGKEPLVSRTLSLLLGPDTSCRIELFGGYCGTLSDMCSLNTLSDVIYKLTEEPDHAISVYNMVHRIKNERAIALVEHRMRQALIIQKALHDYKHQLDVIGHPGIESLSEEVVSSQMESLQAFWDEEVAFYTRYVAELHEDYQFYSDYFRDLEEDYGPTLVKDMLVKINKDIVVSDVPETNDPEQVYQERALSEVAVIDECIQVGSLVYDEDALAERFRRSKAEGPDFLTSEPYTPDSDDDDDDQSDNAWAPED